MSPSIESDKDDDVVQESSEERSDDEDFQVSDNNDDVVQESSDERSDDEDFQQPVPDSPPEFFINDEPLPPTPDSPFDVSLPHMDSDVEEEPTQPTPDSQNNALQSAKDDDFVQENESSNGTSEDEDFQELLPPMDAKEQPRQRKRALDNGDPSEFVCVKKFASSRDNATGLGE